MSTPIVELPLAGHLSFKGNLKTTRYGWLRLTPAYSVHLVNEILENADLSKGVRILDPFCGTGTTALVCAHRGLMCDSTDINPFLIWLAQTKTSSYSECHIVAFHEAAMIGIEFLLDSGSPAPWEPPIHQIEKWWSPEVLSALGRLAHFISTTKQTPVHDLLKIAFCRLCIESSNASFGHQSMSFKKIDKGDNASPILSLFCESVTLQNLVTHWQCAVCDIANGARTHVDTVPRIQLCDALALSQLFREPSFDCVITSPPYPNRMSYIRELRPYMYWLGFLKTGRDAGELDWKAIGGTWGSATSNLNHWQPNPQYAVCFKSFFQILESIGQTSPLLSRYVHKYFEDMVRHVSELWKVTRSGANIHYIVGNSKFYDVMLPVEQIYAALFEAQGFSGVEIKVIRKRTSKKELFEFMVSARRP